MIASLSPGDATERATVFTAATNRSVLRRVRRRSLIAATELACTSIADVMASYSALVGTMKKTAVLAPSLSVGVMSAWTRAMSVTVITIVMMEVTKTTALVSIVHKVNKGLLGCFQVDI